MLGCGLGLGLRVRVIVADILGCERCVVNDGKTKHLQFGSKYKMYLYSKSTNSNRFMSTIRKLEVDSCPDIRSGGGPSQTV